MNISSGAAPFYNVILMVIGAGTRAAEPKGKIGHKKLPQINPSHDKYTSTTGN